VQPRPDTHVGLWLDKYLTEQKDFPGNPAGAGTGARAQTIMEASRCEVPAGYAQAFDRWRGSFSAAETLMVEATTTGRLVIGLGNKNVLEMGLRLDHTWGMPFLPGSALKGLASRVAHLHLNGDGWKRPGPPGELDAGEFHAFLFGSVEQAGAVIFHDAWWKPDSKVKNVPIELDVMTVHHPKYYQNPDQPEPPSDFDSPIPNAFATTFGTFVVVLEKAFPDVEAGWLAIARDLLARGFQIEGLGAKTNAGYGRLSIAGAGGATSSGNSSNSAPPRHELPEAEAKLLGPGNAGTKIPDLLKKFKTQGPDALKAFAVAAIGKLTAKWLKDKKDKAYVKDLYIAADMKLPE